MNPGLLDRRITIERRTITRAATGDAVESWTDWMRDIPARKLHQKFMKAAPRESQQPNEMRLRQFRVRWWRQDLDMTTGDFRIVYEGRIFVLTEIEEVGRREYLDLTAEYRSSNGSVGED